MKRILMSGVVATLFLVHSAFAILSLTLTQGVSSAIPIALVPFSNESQAGVPGKTTLSKVIHDDLQNSGQFRVMEPGLFDKSPQVMTQVDYKHFLVRHLLIYL